MEKIIFISNRKLSNRPLPEIVDEACAAGVHSVQLREKDLDGKELLKLAIRLKEITSKYNAELLISDRLDIALACNANGIQLPENSLSVQTVQSFIKNSTFKIGRSVHSLEGAFKAEEAGADFLIFGHIYETESKKNSPKGLDELKMVCSKIKIPVIALGGITPENAHQCLQFGAHGIAVMSGIMESKNIQKTSESFLNAIENHSR